MWLLLPLPTERLTIREFIAPDRARFLTFMTNPTATRWLEFTGEQRTAKGASELFDAVMKSYGTTKPIAAYTIADLSDDGFIGSCGYSHCGPGALECYWIIHPDSQGQGYGTEAARALTEGLLAEFNTIELRAYIHPENAYSRRLAFSIGMTDRGLGRHPTTGRPGHLFVTSAEDPDAAGA
jgi:RimJ/RimL family protein N-acetyltransferase